MLYKAIMLLSSYQVVIWQHLLTFCECLCYSVSFQAFDSLQLLRSWSWDSWICLWWEDRISHLRIYHFTLSVMYYIYMYLYHLYHLIIILLLYHSLYVIASSDSLLLQLCHWRLQPSVLSILLEFYHKDLRHTQASSNTCQFQNRPSNQYTYMYYCTCFGM